MLFMALIALFIAGLVTLCIAIVMFIRNLILKKTTKTARRLFVISILSLAIPTVCYIIQVHNRPDYIDTGVYATRDMEKDSEYYYQSFELHNKRYVLMDNCDIEGLIKETAVANLDDSGHTIFDKVFLNEKYTLYTVKNDSGYEILTDDYFGSLFCEEKNSKKIKMYYNNYYNYKYYYQLGQVKDEKFDDMKEIVCSKNVIDALKLLDFLDDGEFAQIEVNPDCAMIALKAVSSDGIMKNIKWFVKVENKIYYQYSVVAGTDTCICYLISGELNDFLQKLFK